MKHPRITARFRVVTPLKLHGVNKNRVEFRIPSIKGDASVLVPGSQSAL